jgi:hypothetical protein
LARGVPATVDRLRGCIASAIVTKVLLSIHVLAAIVAIGPVTVAASMFPAAARRAFAEPGGVSVLRNLHRICRVYAVLGVMVPVFGLATASSLGVLGDAWLIVSMILTGVAAGVLAFLILPGQAEVLAGLGGAPSGAFAGAEAAVRASTAADGTLAGAEAPIGAATAADVAAGGVARAGRDARRLGMLTGVFNLLWAVVVVLMIVRPGSTTGV